MSIVHDAFPPPLPDPDEGPAHDPRARTEAALAVLGLFSTLLNRRCDARRVHRLFLQSIRAALDLGLGDLAEQYISAWQMFTRAYSPVPAAEAEAPKAAA